MTIREMIDALEDAASEIGEDTEVRMAYQPNYPLQSHVSGVATSMDVHRHRLDFAEPDEDLDEDDTPEPMVWIVESSQVRDAPYAPRAVFNR